MTHFYLAPESEAEFRAITHSRLISHIRKVCACGRQTTAKDLTQYGMCNKCQHAAKKKAPVIQQVCGSADNPANNRRFVLIPSLWKKAGTA